MSDDKLPPDLEFFRKLGINITVDPNCPPDRIYLSSPRRRHPDITVHEGPDKGKIIPGDWAETEEEWARRCGVATNIGTNIGTGTAHGGRASVRNKTRGAR